MGRFWVGFCVIEEGVTEVLVESSVRVFFLSILVFVLRFMCVIGILRDGFCGLGSFRMGECRWFTGFITGCMFVVVIFSFEGD